ncbi:hypothetical protein FQA39_LY12210 [Lamprigera yunnana]|nr:hypothetical protein FQA39_LY12210 [Lamprigera yunnana]
MGVDPNRNFDFCWNQIGSSNKENAGTYAGPYPFSEPETAALSQFIIKNCSHIKLYLSFHSCEQCIIYPFGFTKRLPPNVERLHNLAVEVQQAIHAVNGNVYITGNSPTILRPSSGSSRDWVYAVAGVELSYTVELPAGGKKGFDLPAKYILAVVEEIFEGIKVFHKHVQEEYYSEKLIAIIFQARFWRKTRSHGRSFRGVDLNRNFDFHWKRKGVNSKESSETYAGPRPFSEPETVALKHIIINNVNHIKLYISFHSAAQCIIYPYAHKSKLPKNKADLHKLAVSAKKAIMRVNGTEYGVGTIAACLKVLCGTSCDWVYGIAGVELAYMIELKGGGTRGFDLPETEIANVVTEVFEGLEKNLDIDIWSSLQHVAKPVDIMVNPKTQFKFEQLLKIHGIRYHVRINNVEENVQRERLHQERTAISRKGKISFTAFNSMPEIDIYLNYLEAKYPNLVQLERLGGSYEGRSLRVIKISTNPSANKPVIFIDAGIHAREFIAPAQALYVIQELVQNSSNINLLDKVDWHILPVVNPDGYVHAYSFERYWRKTRKPSGNGCRGTDGNRNFGFHWGEVGASNNPCDNTYMGSQAFSESETLLTKNYIEANKNRIKLYLTFHSYGNYLLYPWGYTSELPPNNDQLFSLAVQVNRAIVDAGGDEYTIGTSTNVLYAAAGGSDDWAMGVAGISLSYTIELPGWDFVVSPSLIQKYVTETFEGVRVYGNYVADNYA